MSSAHFLIPSSDPALLERATQIAKEFVQPFIGDEIVGIVFLGAIARGYFDHAADIDIGLFKKQSSRFATPDKFLKIEGHALSVAR